MTSMDSQVSPEEVTPNITTPDAHVIREKEEMSRPAEKYNEQNQDDFENQNV